MIGRGVQKIKFVYDLLKSLDIDPIKNAINERSKKIARFACWLKKVKITSMPYSGRAGHMGDGSSKNNLYTKSGYEIFSKKFLGKVANSKSIMIVDSLSSGLGMASFLTHIKNICKEHNKQINMVLSTYVKTHSKIKIAKIFSKKDQSFIDPSEIKSGQELVAHFDGASPTPEGKECLELYDYANNKIPVKFSIPMISQKFQALKDAKNLFQGDFWDAPPMNQFAHCYPFKGSSWDKKESDLRI